MVDVLIRIWAKGNPGNIMMMYLSALKIQKILGYGSVINTDISIFNIHIPDVDTSGLFGVHDHMPTNDRNAGYVPARAIAHAVRQSGARFVSLEGNCQNVENFIPQDELDYDRLFPPLSGLSGGKEDELVISIRGGEVLQAVHPDYCLLPPDFYKYIVSISEKKPIFYGQVEDNPYMTELRQMFPDAKFIASRGVREDFDYLRKSKHIVLSLSTFSWMAAWLSHAQTIYFPVAGILSPFQHGNSMLLPLNDKRYRFFKFPIFKALSVEQYREYIDPVRGAWSQIDAKELQRIIPQRRTEIDDYVIALDPVSYSQQSHIRAEAFAVFGDIAMYNDYMTDGFFSGVDFRKMDTGLYTRRYPKVAHDLTTGVFKNALDHYARVGQYMGLLAD